MAAGKVTVLDIAEERFGLAGWNLRTDSFKVALTTSAQAIAADFAGASGNATYADLTAEVVGTGYTATGKALGNPTWTRVDSVTSFSADAVTWAGLDATFKYGVIYRVADGRILAFFDMDTASPTGRTVAAADFTINWTGKLFDLARTA